MSNRQNTYGKILPVVGMNPAGMIRKNLKHFIFVGILGIYLLSANKIYTNLVMDYGKPAVINPSLPEPTKNLVFNLDRLETSVYGGEDLYKLIGFAFEKTNPAGENRVMKIILHSVKEDLLFDPEVMERNDVTLAFPEYNANLDRCGFFILISKNVLQVDNYQVGILFEDQQGNPITYHLTGAYIERTPNFLRLIVGP